jgi:cytochrome c-type biogenesis protein
VAVGGETPGATVSGVEAKIPLAFVAGLVSFVTPCVLPLVPGYLSAVSGGQPGATGRRVVGASLPFVAGFTLVFVTLGAAAGLAGNAFGQNQQLLRHLAGVIVVAFGFAMMGLLPLPYLDRLAAPGVVEGARRSGSSVLLGGAFAFCAAPCVGPVLASILLLATDATTVAEAALLLLVYSLGLALPFLVVGIAFGRAMSAFRWLRDRYVIVRVASGAVLVAIGLLLFFDRFWWLNVGVNRAFELIGLGD